MAYSKTYLFEKGLQFNAKIFKALAHPARLSILKYLAETRTCITGDITEELPLSRTTVKQHLNELKEAGLIQGTIEGVKTNYCLNCQRIKEMHEVIHNFFTDLVNYNQNNCC